MNNTNQTYNTAGIQYSYRKAARKWEFTDGKFSLFQPCLGGVSVARRVASQFKAGLTRTGGNGLDALARGAIRKITGY